MNIEPYVTEESSGYQADEVMFYTRLSQEEVLEQFDSYFIEEPEPTISDLVEAIDILAEIVMEE